MYEKFMPYVIFAPKIHEFQEDNVSQGRYDFYTFNALLKYPL